MLCLALTVTNQWNIANAAHFGGLAFGALIGFSVIRPELRPRLLAMCALVTLISPLAPYLPIRGFASPSARARQEAYEVEMKAYEAQQARDYVRSLALWEQALSSPGANREVILYNVAVIHHELGDEEKCASTRKQLADANFGESAQLSIALGH